MISEKNEPEFKNMSTFGEIVEMGDIDDFSKTIENNIYICSNCGKVFYRPQCVTFVACCENMNSVSLSNIVTDWFILFNNKKK